MMGLKKIFRNATLALAALFAAVCMFSPASVAAEDLFQDVCSKPGASQSTVCKDKQKTGNPLFGPDGILTFGIRLMSFLVGIAAVFMIMIGGLKFITSGNNSQDTNRAREMILYAIVGLIIAAVAQLIVNLFLVKIGN